MPVLIALVYLFSQLVPPTQPTPREAFTQSCVAACQQNGSEQLTPAVLRLRGNGTGQGKTVR
jgi:uncharacterized membrane protein